MINITCDIWSDASMRSFIAFSAHGMNSQWIPVTGIISCIRLKGHHTNDVIYSNFEAEIQAYGLEDKIHKIITDSGSNMVKAFNVNSKLSEMNSKIDNIVADESNANEKDDEDDEVDYSDSESESSDDESGIIDQYNPVLLAFFDF